MSVADPLLPRSLRPAPGWKRIDSQAEADQLHESFAGFHDAVIKELHFDSGGAVEADRVYVSRLLPQLRVLFQCPWGPLALELYFYGLSELTSGTELHGVLGGASLKWTPESVTWEGDGTVIRGAVALWRLAPEWVGNRPRYLSNELDLEVADPLSLYLYGETFQYRMQSEPW